MNTRMQTDAWIFLIVIVLGLILVGSMAATLILMIAGRPRVEILVAFAIVAAGGLSRLLISPLNRKLYE